MEEKEQHVEDVKEKTAQSSNGKKKSVAIIVVGVILIAIIVVLILVIMNLTKPISKFKRNFDVASEEELIEMYESIESSDDKNKANEIVKEKINDVISQYAKETITYEEAIESIEKYEFSTARYNSGKADVNSLKTSKDSFNQALEKEKSANYAEAIELYSKVIKDDTSNYEEAQSRIIDCKDVVKTEYLGKIQAAIDNANYPEALAELDKALTVLTNDADLIAKQQEYKDSYKNTVLTSVDALIKEEKYVEADAELETALKVMKDDADLTAKRNQISKIVEEIKTTVQIGQSIIDENNYEISFLSSAFTTRVNPTRPDSYYTYYAVKDAANNKYLVLKTKIKNLGATTLDGDSLPGGTVMFDGKYTYNTFTVTEEDDGSDLEGYSWYQDIEPLKTKKIWYLVELPNEVIDSTDKSLVVDFVINDITYHVKIR